jgi:hypothetical protein
MVIILIGRDTQSFVDARFLSTPSATTTKEKRDEANITSCWW